MPHLMDNNTINWHNLQNRGCSTYSKQCIIYQLKYLNDMLKQHVYARQRQIVALKQKYCFSSDSEVNVKVVENRRKINGSGQGQGSISPAVQARDTGLYLQPCRLQIQVHIPSLHRWFGKQCRSIQARDEQVLTRNMGHFNLFKHRDSEERNS